MPLEATNSEIALTDISLSEVHSLQCTETFYVDPTNGVDTEGLGRTWANAFRTIIFAISQAGDGVSDFTRIYLALGAHDTNAGGVQAVVDRQIVLHGSVRGQTLLFNSNVAAAVVLTLADTSIITQCSIVPVAEQDGLLITADFCRVESVNVWCGGVTGAQDGIHLDGVECTRFSDVLIDGDVAFTTGVLLDNSDIGHASHVHVLECLVGVHFTNGAAENDFEYLDVHNCATGILVDALCDQSHLDHLDLVGNTVHVNDLGTETQLTGAVHVVNLTGTVAPDDLTGVVVATGGALAWGVDVQIRSAVAATRPFYITGITYELSVQERYQIRLSDDGGTSYFWSGVVEERVATRTKFLIFSDKFLIRQGEAIHASVRDESGGDTCTIWIHIKEI